MLIKGDDLRIALVVDKSQMKGMSESDFAKSIMEVFKDKMKLFGHTIKISESYCSSIFLAFSKLFRHDDVIYSGILRKAQKIHGYSNALLPTFDDQVASIFSNAHSAGLYGYCPIGLYYTATFMSSYLLSINDIYSKCSEEALSSLLLVPNVIGGLPTIQLHNMIIREESDHLSSIIELYLFCIKKYPFQANIIYNFLCSNPKHQKIDKPYMIFTNLLYDPYSVSNDIPIQPSAFIRKRVIFLIISIVFSS